jgi:hypothetical protein
MASNGVIDVMAHDGVPQSAHGAAAVQTGRRDLPLAVGDGVGCSSCRIRQPRSSSTAVNCG